MTEKRIMKLASRGKRFGAACIDIFVPFVSYLMILAVLLANGINPYYPGYGYGFGNNYGFGYGYGYGFGYGIGRHHLSGASAAIMAVVIFIFIGYTIAEFILFARGKTIGKAMLGLQVVSSEDGKPFRFWKMFFREIFVKSASGSVFGLGFIWILIDEKNRGWHDKILDSYVVDLKESERINYKRNLAQTSKAESAAAPEPAPEVRQTEPAAAETRPAEEPVMEVSSKVVGIETEMVPDRMPEVSAEEPAEGFPEDDSANAAEVTPEEISEEAAETAAEETADDISEETAAEEISEEVMEKASAPELSMSMKKEDLLEEARRRGVTVSSRATKAAIIEAVEKAAENEKQ